MSLTKKNRSVSNATTTIRDRQIVALHLTVSMVRIRSECAWSVNGEEMHQRYMNDWDNVVAPENKITNSQRHFSAAGAIEFISEYESHDTRSHMDRWRIVSHCWRMNYHSCMSRSYRRRWTSPLIRSNSNANKFHFNDFTLSLSSQQKITDELSHNARRLSPWLPHVIRWKTKANNDRVR